jgi:ABC-type Na+ efflux pump permease subunit
VTVHWDLVTALFRKDLEEIRHNRQIFYPMLVLPVLLTGESILTFYVSLLPSESAGLAPASALFISGVELLVVPLILPIVLGAATVVLEKTNRTLEPLLSSPLSDQELLLAKALAPLVPALAITAASYATFGAGALLLVSTHHPGLALPWAALLVMALLLAPLLGLLSMFVALAVSSRAKDVRGAQQVATFVALPILLVVLGLGIALGPNPLALAALAIGLALSAYGALQVTVRRFHRDEILVAEAS